MWVKKINLTYISEFFKNIKNIQKKHGNLHSDMRSMFKQLTEVLIYLSVIFVFVYRKRGIIFKVISLYNEFSPVLKGKLFCRKIFKHRIELMHIPFIF
ncbi:unnamed protein product [Brugia timori]|uniref:Uncharacterized protein n=1 Tax=Brugia timori TaxID=42155 RepID=A0A3P7YRD1_9BILA|nr:unnamed protein product [Brugia timori]